MTIDDCDAKRMRLLAGYGLSFAVWGGALAAMMIFIVSPGVGTSLTAMPSLSPAAGIALVGIQLAAFAAWMFFLVRLAILGRRVSKDPVLLEAARDERSRKNQRDAFFLAFWVVMIAVGLTIPLEVRFGIAVTASTFASVAIWLGVTTALLAYVWMERRDAA